MGVSVEQLAREVKAVRDLQRRFFDGDRSVVGEAKKRERRLDLIVAEVLAGPTLFDRPATGRRTTVFNVRGHDKAELLAGPTLFDRPATGRRTTVFNVRGHDKAELTARPDFVYVGRRCGPWPASVWGNPFKPGMTPWDAIEVFFAIPADDRLGHPESEMDVTWNLCRLYEAYVRARRSLRDRLPELKGRTLGCWCLDWDGEGDPPMTCHAVVLATLAEEAR